MFALTAWECTSFEKRKLAAAPLYWLHDLTDGEIADVYAILEGRKPRLSRRLRH